jgi:hypothetical protein
VPQFRRIGRAEQTEPLTGVERPVIGHRPRDPRDQLSATGDRPMLISSLTEGYRVMDVRRAIKALSMPQRPLALCVLSRDRGAEPILRRFAC